MLLWKPSRAKWQNIRKHALKINTFLFLSRWYVCFLAPKEVELLNIIHRVMHSNVMRSISTNVVFKRISFAIHKGLVAQLVSRLPSTSMLIQVKVLMKESLSSTKTTHFYLLFLTLDHECRRAYATYGSQNYGLCFNGTWSIIFILHKYLQWLFLFWSSLSK